MFGVPQMRIPNTARSEIDHLGLIIQLLVVIPIILGLVPLLSNKRTLFKSGIGLLLVGLGFLVAGSVMWLEISAMRS
jgi:Na+-translocating ferredoxin:NAD+ oxidoreductase RnfE subunit